MKQEKMTHNSMTTGVNNIVYNPKALSSKYVHFVQYTLLLEVISAPAFMFAPWQDIELRPAGMHSSFPSILVRSVSLSYL